MLQKLKISRRFDFRFTVEDLSPYGVTDPDSTIIGVICLYIFLQRHGGHEFIMISALRKFKRCILFLCLKIISFLNFAVSSSLKNLENMLCTLQLNFITTVSERISGFRVRVYILPSAIMRS